MLLLLDLFVWLGHDYVIFFPLLLHTAPSPPSLMSFADVTNTSLAITWKVPPDWTDYSDFELQWSPRDTLTVFNPYGTKKSEGRIMHGLRPGRSYQFSVQTVSGDSWRTYSKPIFGSVRTSMICFAIFNSGGVKWGYMLQYHTALGLNPVLLGNGFAFNSGKSHLDRCFCLLIINHSEKYIISVLMKLAGNSYAVGIQV